VCAGAGAGAGAGAAPPLNFTCNAAHAAGNAPAGEKKATRGHASPRN